MPKYIYQAKERSGLPPKGVTGIVEAANVNQAAVVLKGKGLVPIGITSANQSFSAGVFTKLFSKKISLTELTNFTRNLSTMLSSGLPLTETLVLLKSQSSQKMAVVIEDLLITVESGENLSEGLARHPDVFSKVYVALIKAGESAGVVDQIFARLADTLEKQRIFKSKVKGAMIYPTIIVFGMITVIFLMMVLVIPKLTSLYKEFGSKLPAPTQFLISASDFTVKNLFLILLLMVGSVYGFILFRKTPAGKRKMDNFQLRLPIFGNLQKLIILTEVSRTLGMLIGAGVQIVEALNIVAVASENYVFEEGMKVVAKQVEKGLPLAQALSRNENFPQIMAQLVSVGEETGKLDEFLSKISHFFELESDETLKSLTTAIEPLIMIILGVGVGFLIIAIILPIYNLTTQF